jgi:hypothetical protein
MGRNGWKRLAYSVEKAGHREGQAVLREHRRTGVVDPLGVDVIAQAVDRGAACFAAMDLSKNRRWAGRGGGGARYTQAQGRRLGSRPQ